ncbi:MAG TPA: exodeoxyribonuclease V subunit gamma, partial [Solirubrobacteraceae bacterium]|nr:exodeoxyribonuclease V subunit gamma [Solirubrobacteraceae bacterium]
MLHVHRAARADALAAALRDLLATPLDDPFAPELIAVPTRGMERWLAQTLSTGLGTTDGRRDGVCANVDFPSPGRLVSEAVAAASGIDPERDRWLSDRLVWPLLEVVDEALAEPWLDALAAHLGGGRGRRFGTVRHLAALYDAYGLHRPEMVRGWAAGEDEHWQAELWRRLRAKVGQPSPAERLETAVARLRDAPDLVDAPRRLSLFGLTRLPASHLAALGGLAAARDVHLFLLHPSAALWDAAAPVLEATGAVARRADDRTADLPQNRLLASWGRDARELQVVLGAREHVDHHHPIAAGEASLLERIQGDVRADRGPRARDERPLLAEDD